MNMKSMVQFYPSIDDSKLDFAVLVAFYHGKWVLCKHRERDTYEFPGGKRECGESIDVTARRELFETNLCLFCNKGRRTGIFWYALSRRYL